MGFPLQCHDGSATAREGHWGAAFFNWSFRECVLHFHLVAFIGMYTMVSSIYYTSEAASGLVDVGLAASDTLHSIALNRFLVSGFRVSACVCSYPRHRTPHGASPCGFHYQDCVEKQIDSVVSVGLSERLTF